jgi:hypothetical protein
MCSPNTLSSIGEVSAASPKDAVLQRGEDSILEIMAAPKVGMTTTFYVVAWAFVNAVSDPK